MKTIILVFLLWLSGIAYAGPITHNGTTINMGFVKIGYINNPWDATLPGYPGHPYGTAGHGFGKVMYNYSIGRSEVTIDQFATVNAADSRIGNGNENYWNDGTRTLGNDVPATYVSWYEAAKFCNWMTTGDAYTGVYNFTSNGTYVGVDRESALNVYGKAYVIPTEDEWHKAAYFKADGTGYSSYPTGNVLPLPGSEENYNNAISLPWAVESGHFENNGSYDMGGNVDEWTESALDGISDNNLTARDERGGAYNSSEYGLSSVSRGVGGGMGNESPEVGFRVSLIWKTWPDYHLTNGTHYSSYGVEDYDPDTTKNLYIDPGAVLQAGSTELDDIYDGNQVYLNGGTIHTSAIDADDFTWNSGDLYLDGGTHSTLYGLDSGSNKLMHVSDGATLQNFSLSTWSGNNRMILYEGGRLSVSNFNATGLDVYGGTLYETGELTGLNTPDYYNTQIILDGENAVWRPLVYGDGYLAVTVRNGALLDAGYANIGYHGTGQLEVTGAGSRWMGSFTIGTSYDGEGSVSLRNGGQLVGGYATIGTGSSSGNMLSVSDPGSELHLAGRLTIGWCRSGNNALLISNGATASCGSCTIGDYSVLNRVIVTGANSAWVVQHDIEIGIDEESNYVKVSNGGFVACSNLYIGGISGHYQVDDNHVNVSGMGSYLACYGKLVIGGDFYNWLTVSDGAEAYIGQVVSITATGYEYDSYLEVHDGGRLLIGTNFNASMLGFLFETGGVLAVEGELTGLPVLQQGRRLEAVQIADALTVHGTFTPLSGPGACAVNDSLTISTDGTLEMELGGSAAASEYDQLAVGGVAYLDGTLHIILSEGFSPTNGAVFELFDWSGGVVGTFAEINLPNLPEGLAWNCTELYTAGRISVIYAPNSTAPGWWKNLYFGTSNICDSIDADGDGLDNLHEFIAGTDPTNQLSHFVAHQDSGISGDVIGWTSYSGRYYRVWWSTNLLHSFRLAEYDLIYPQNCYTDSVHGTEQQLFYKIDVGLDPNEGGTPLGMVHIPAGRNEGNDPDYGHYAHATDAFYMDQNEITGAQWSEVLNWAVTNGYAFENIGDATASNHPVHSVNWFDCAKWCNARSEMQGWTPCYTITGAVYRVGDHEADTDYTANGYRMPTREEWEYAARGGLVGKRYPWGDSISSGDANYGSSQTSAGGLYPANGYGLNDMAGNVWEWCNDITAPGRRGRAGGGYTSSELWLRLGAPADGETSNQYRSLGFRTIRK